MLHVLAASLTLFAPQDGIPLDANARFERRITPEVEVVRKCQPAIVYIRTEWTETKAGLFGMPFTEQGSGAGSGVVVHKQGFIITNYHVVKNAKQIVANFAPELDTQDYPAQLVSFVEEEDLALLKIHSERELKAVELGTSADLMLGERVIAIGNPSGRTYSVSMGIISGLHRDVTIQDGGLHYDDLIQTDAAINRGNSGGALLNINGELIGINSVVDTHSQNIGFSIPVDRVKQVMQSRLMSPDAARTWLGYDVDDRLAIKNIVAGSPASTAGLQPGDCIVTLGGQNVRTSEEYRLARISLPPKQPVALRYERAGKTREISLTPWEASDGTIFQRIGVRCDELVISGLRVVMLNEVQAGGPAAQLGLESGDIFNAVRVQLEPRPRTFRVRSKNDLAEILNDQAKPGMQLEVEVLRDVNRDQRFSMRDELHRGLITVR